MSKTFFTNAHIVDPTQKINKIGSITVENKKIQVDLKVVGGKRTPLQDITNTIFHQKFHLK